MATESLSDRLKALVLTLSSNPDELYRYSEDPDGYLRGRGFPKEAISAITTGSQALQALLAREGGAGPVFTVQGIKGYRAKPSGGGGRKK